MPSAGPVALSSGRTLWVTAGIAARYAGATRPLMRFNAAVAQKRIRPRQSIERGQLHSDVLWVTC